MRDDLCEPAHLREISKNYITFQGANSVGDSFYRRFTLPRICVEIFR